MNYLQKEKDLIKALSEKNFPPKGNKEITMRMLEKATASFPEYHNTVVAQQALMPIWRVTKEAAEYRACVQDFDRSRKLAHDCAINGVNILNRMCKLADLEPFSTVDTEDRHAVAEFIGEYCASVYNEGINQPEGKEKTAQQERRYSNLEIKGHMEQVTEGLEL